jgi:hypothetical protein
MMKRKPSMKYQRKDDPAPVEQLMELMKYYMKAAIN